MRVFVVEDSQSLRERLIKMITAISGVQVVGYAPEAKGAIEQINSIKPDVVLLDIRLTESSGYQVLKSIDKNEKPIVIVLTNYAFPQYRQKFLEAGADYFFDKSTEFDRVMSVLKDLRGKK